MIYLDLTQLIAAMAFSEPTNIRTIAFDVPTFHLLRDFQRRLESRFRRGMNNTETLKYLIRQHPAVMVAW